MLPEDIKTLRNALTETQETLQKAPNDLEEDCDVKKLGEAGTDMRNICALSLEMTDPLEQYFDAHHARNGAEYFTVNIQHAACTDGI